VSTLTEAEIQKSLIKLLQFKGFDLTYHTRYSLGSDPGFPDIVAARAGQIVAIECKGARGALRPKQVEWIEMFRTVPGCVMAEVVGPTDGDRWIGYDQALDRIGDL
jgi:Holliday junction resolvase